MLSQIVIFGASGDLTARKLIPALWGNAREQAFPGPVQVIGVSRRPKEDATWRRELSAWLPADQRADFLGSFASQIHYVQGDTSHPDDIVALKAKLEALAGGQPCGRLFYLALRPRLFLPTVSALHGAGLLDGAAWCRVVVEKPFGTDLETAQALNAGLGQYLREDQILRIDHYLGKETVQNILAFRFQNAIFERLWNRRHVDSVEISVCESVAVEGGRAGYFDGAGTLRDMVQNHLLQVLALVAMEPPNSMDPEAVRAEKVKVLDALRAFTGDEVRENVVRARYRAGASHDTAYRDEQGVAPDSTTETYVAARATIDNWRWAGVPFLLRTGKALERRATEVVMRFRVPPIDLLNGPAPAGTCALRPNALTILIQPQEGIRLSFLVKEPGSGTVMRPASLGFDYDDLFAGRARAPAYQRLLLDAIEGNTMLFIRGDEVEAAWRFADAIRAGWAEGAPLYEYAAGGRGPDEADALFRGCEGIWGDWRRG